jgi:hypothetical protein
MTHDGNKQINKRQGWTFNAVAGFVVTALVLWIPLLAYRFWWPAIPLGLLFWLSTSLLIDSLVKLVTSNGDSDQ